MNQQRQVANYPTIRRKLVFIRLRVAVRRCCDVLLLGKSLGARFASIVVLSVVPFAAVLGISFALGIPGAAAIAFALAGFIASLSAGAILTLVGTDEQLATQRAVLLQELPAAKSSWLADLERRKAEREARAAAIARQRELLANERQQQQDRELDRRETHHSTTTSWLDGNGEYNFEVVGESNYQGALERACGARTEKSQDRIVQAILVLNNRNRYDPQAVCVTVGGLTVGYLSREHAKRFRARLQRERIRGREFPCRGNIRGGWDRGNGDRGNFGIWLDVCIYAK